VAVRNGWHQGFESLLAEIEVLDAHVHPGRWTTFAGQATAGADAPGAPDLAAIMEARHSNAAFLLASPHTDGSADAVRAANDAVMVAARDSPGGLGWAAGVPMHDADAAVAEAARSVASGATAVVFHHRFSGLVIDAPIMWPIMAGLSRLSVPVMVHCVAESALEALWRLERLAETFPLQFVALDAFGSPSSAQSAVAVARRRLNVCFDTATATPVGRFVQQFADAVGPDRLIYGSDLYVEPPSYDFPGTLFEILASGLGLPAKRAILGANARRVLL
jgi:uncharacterized protein